MLSFNVFALAVAAVLPFVSAAPAPLTGVNLNAAAKAHVGLKPLDVDVKADADVSLAARYVKLDADLATKAKIRPRDATSIASILVDLQVNLGDEVCHLHHFTAKNATSENLTVVLKGVVSVVNTAVTDLKALKGKSSATILASLDGKATLTVSEVAQLLANVISTILLGLKVVVSVIADVKVLVKVVANVALGGCLCNLINAVVALVGGLILALAPLLSSVASLLTTLGLTTVGTLLTIL
ncbi:hypothetical protein PNOK_0609400 [Pyrrhoderma noxium]|uniref:Uncharacterized protein n=1 Tax=Pyrrhoderma noxium TaxID=2282107 RepID=A0A286UDI6_9AGAM|nr:hypothetical protein PNOK_0609400 [Pyrrhoderma noxium]